MLIYIYRALTLKMLLTNYDKVIIQLNKKAPGFMESNMSPRNAKYNERASNKANCSMDCKKANANSKYVLNTEAFSIFEFRKPKPSGHKMNTLLSSYKTRVSEDAPKSKSTQDRTQLEKRRASAATRYTNYNNNSKALNASSTLQTPYPSSIRLKERFYTNTSNKLRIGSESSSLDYSINTALSPSRDHGAKMFGKPVEKFNRETTPGPGHYQPKYCIRPNPQRTVFGTEKKKVLERLLGSDARDFYTATPSNNSGHSFSKERKEATVQFSSATPGPGHYNHNDKSVRPNPMGTIISLADTCPIKRFTTDEVICEEPSVSPKSSLENKSNFQKFSNLRRFVDTSERHRYVYNRIIFPRRSEAAPIVRKNISSTSKETKQEKIRRIMEGNTKLRLKIAYVQQSKQRIEDESLQKITISQQASERRRLIYKEKEILYKLRQSWLHCTTLGGLLKLLAGKYNNRKEVRKRTSKLMRILFVCLWSVGKIIKKRKAIGHKRVIRTLTAMARSNAVFWRMRRKIKAKQRISKFVAKYEGNPRMLLFLKFVISQVCRIQRWFRRIYIQKKMLLGIMNYQWSIIEGAVLNIRAMEKKDRQTLLRMVNEYVKERKTTDIVPLGVRMFYIKRALKIMNAKFYENSEQYWKYYKETREKALRQHELMNTENMLRGIPAVPFVFNKKILAKCRMFIRRTEMVDLVSNALVERIKWDTILKKENTKGGGSRKCSTCVM